MLREFVELDAQGFSFADHGQQKAPAIVTVEQSPDGATATIPDAHLLFNSDFARAGNDLLLNGSDGERAIVRDYFTSAERPALMSAEGARLSPGLVDALTRTAAPDQYAQATPTAPSAADAVGRVVTASADSIVLRNGAPVTVRPGDPILRADVLQTAGGAMAVSFNDGSTLNLTPNTRIVVSEFVYSPNGTGNSQLLDLVQGSLTFISGEVAHSGDMRIGTPVATMGIRGTVGGVTTASDGTVQFYVSQSATGAVIMNAQGQIIANVVQDGPLIIVRPVGPLEVVADEIQKSPQQLAIELQALQQIVSIKAIGDQILQQFLQPQQSPSNQQSPQNGPHTQIQTDDKLKITLFYDGTPGSGDANALITHAILQPIPQDPGAPPPPPIEVTLPVAPNLPPVTFAPQTTATAEDTVLTFSGASAITIADADSGVLTVTLTVTNGQLTLASVAGLSFSTGDGSGDATMTFSGSPAAINAALHGMTFKPFLDYNGAAVLSITHTDGHSAPTTTTVGIDIAAVNDAPVISDPVAETVSYTENDAATVVNASLTLSDVDSATLSGATVKISGHFHAGEDVLSFTSHGGITGSYDPQTGVLTLSGVASVADYQAVLRSVTYSNSSDDPSDDARTIEFKVSDGSAENSTSNSITSIVEVTAVNDAPVLNHFNIELNGDEPIVLTAANYDVADPDGPEIIFTVTNVTGGSFVVTSGGSLWSSTQDGPAPGPITFTAADIEAGRVTFVPDGSGDPVSYSISVWDGGNNTVPTDPIVDHVPVAQDMSVEVSAGALPDFNTCFVLDYSLSIDSAELGQMLSAVKAAAAVLFAGPSAVTISLVAFGRDAAYLGSFTSLSDFEHAIDATAISRPVDGSGTNFSVALEQVMEHFGLIEGVRNDVFFISDGQSTLTSGVAEDWHSFVNCNGVNVTAVGIGNGINEDRLREIDVDGSGDVVTVDEFGDLVDELVTLVGGQETHNIFAEEYASVGGDGGRVLSITVDGKTYTWDGVGTVSSDSNAEWSHTAASVTVMTVLGGKLTFYFGDEGSHEKGEWTYTAPESVAHASDEVFRYTLIDHDGDRASANITVHVLDPEEPEMLARATGPGQLDGLGWVPTGPGGSHTIRTVSSDTHDAAHTPGLDGFWFESADHSRQVASAPSPATPGLDGFWRDSFEQSHHVVSSPVAATPGLDGFWRESGDHSHQVASTPAPAMPGLDGFWRESADHSRQVASTPGSATPGVEGFWFESGDHSHQVASTPASATPGVDGFWFETFQPQPPVASIDVGVSHTDGAAVERHDGDHYASVDTTHGDLTGSAGADPMGPTAADFIFHPAQYTVG